MNKVAKIETGRMENGTLVITDTQWGVFIGDEVWSKHDTEKEAQTELVEVNNPVLR